MSRIRLVLIGTVLAGMLGASMNPAHAIVVVVPSASRVPFPQDYPEHARKLVREALETKNCAFIGGVSSIRATTLNFAGDTASINAQLQKLANCPAATVAVSFVQLDHKCDWRIDHVTSSNTFKVVVNLRSERIALEKLNIPPAHGPFLESQPSRDDRSTP